MSKWCFGRVAADDNDDDGDRDRIEGEEEDDDGDDYGLHTRTLCGLRIHYYIDVACKMQILHFISSTISSCLSPCVSFVHLNASSAIDIYGFLFVFNFCIFVVVAPVVYHHQW